jgi:murein DD-endopeptidase MepM/ murein hydrolase activator NlpD
MPRTFPRSILAAAVAALLLAGLVGGPAHGAGAQQAPGIASPPVSDTSSSTSSTVEVPPASGPAVTDDPALTVAPTIPVDPGGSTNPTGADAQGYQNDDDLVGRGLYASQGAFDPASKQGLPEDLARGRGEQRAAAGRAARAESDLDQARLAVATIQTELAQLEESQRLAVEAAATAKAAFVDTAVSAYMHGRESESFALLDSDNPTEYARRTQLLSAVLDRDSRVAADYRTKRDVLSDDLQQRLDSVDRISQAAESAVLAALDAEIVLRAADWQVRTFENDSRVWVPGFMFPVDGPVQFVDSFGYPRQLGTGQQHWHEGTDVMAAAGTPMVAVEDGVVTKVGENTLGGLSVKITGASGYWYYYAHLSAFAPGLAEGAPIAAGTLIGYVGDSGDAKGGPTHLHFEVHQPDGKALDPFGLLKTAWQARQQALGLGGSDPVVGSVGSAGSVGGDPGTNGGFPRFIDGRPVYADPAHQPAFDPAAPPATALPTTAWSVPGR